VAHCNLGDSLHGPAVYLKRHCPFKQAYDTWCERRAWGPVVVAFRHKKSNGHRPYDLFVVHLLTKWTSEHEVFFRLLPLPASAFELTLRDEGMNAADNSRLLHFPSALRVLGPAARLLHARAYVLTSPDEIEAVTRARDFYEPLLLDLNRDVAPPAAWHAAEERDAHTAASVPVYLRNLFDGKLPSADVASKITGVWTHAWDAPVLVTEVMPEIWDAIRHDARLRYIPKGNASDTDRLRYLRARLPLSELEDQDQYLHWAPIPGDWDRAAIRTELYSF
jgi:hypothetical protein